MSDIELRLSFKTPNQEVADILRDELYAFIDEFTTLHTKRVDNDVQIPAYFIQWEIDEASRL